MKKILVLSMFLLPFCAIAYEETPLLMDTSAIQLEYEEDDNNLINVNGMKKSDKINQTRNELRNTENRKIMLDNRQLHFQRALDYTTRQSNSMLPLF